MPEQLHFDLPRREALGRDAFVVADANALAVAMIDAPAGWPSGRLVLTGAAGAGKTHLTHVWAAAQDAQIVAAADLPSFDIPAHAPGATAIEDLDQCAGTRAVEEAMFHLLNLAAAERGLVLITARTPPRDWGLVLPDLLSRLNAAQTVRIDPPDDALLTAVLMKHFADRQLAPTPDALGWLMKRLTRRFDAVAEAAGWLDTQALAAGREINRALVQELASDKPHLFD